MYLRCCWSFWSNIYIPVYLTMLLNCLEQYLYAYDVVESYGALSLYLWCWRISWNSMSVLMMLLNPLEHYFCTYDFVESLGTLFLYLRCCWIPWDPSEHCDVAPAEDRPSGRTDRTSSGWYNGPYCKSKGWMYVLIGDAYVWYTLNLKL